MIRNRRIGFLAAVAAAPLAARAVTTCGGAGRFVLSPAGDMVSGAGSNSGGGNGY
jgi:hypothetical protein